MDDGVWFLQMTSEEKDDDEEEDDGDDDEDDGDDDESVECNACCWLFTRVFRCANILHWLLFEGTSETDKYGKNKIE